MLVLVFLQHHSAFEWGQSQWMCHCSASHRYLINTSDHNHGVHDRTDGPAGLQTAETISSRRQTEEIHLGRPTWTRCRWRFVNGCLICWGRRCVHWLCSHNIDTALHVRSRSIITIVSCFRALMRQHRVCVCVWVCVCLCVWICSTQCGDATLTVYQGKPRKNICIVSTVHTAVGTFSGAKAKPESLMCYNNTEYGVDVPDRMARPYSVTDSTEDGQWRSSITSSTWLDQCPHLIQGAPAAGEPGGKSCSSWQRSWGQRHGGERGRGSRHKVGNHHSSSRRGHGGSAGPKELQTEPNVGHFVMSKANLSIFQVIRNSSPLFPPDLWHLLRGL